MATIKIPGSIFPNDNLNNNEELFERTNDTDDHDVHDPLDNPLESQVDFTENEEPIEHADLDCEKIAGNESGYDSPLDRLEQEIYLAEHDAENNRPDDSLKHRIRVLTLSRIVYSSDDWKIGRYQIDVAKCYMDVKGSKYAIQTEEHAKEGIKILNQNCVEVFLEAEMLDFLKTLMEGYFLLAKSRMILKNYNDSYKSITKAISNVEKMEKLTLVTDDDIYNMKFKLFLAAGKISLKCNELSKSEYHFTATLELVKQHRDEESTELIQIYHMLAQVEQQRGSLSNHYKSINYCQTAHEISNKHYETHSDEIILSSWILALSYAVCGDIDSEKSAETYLNDCIESVRARFGDTHERLHTLRMELAKLYIRSDRIQDAIDELRRIMKLEEAVFGEYCAESIESFQILASVYLTNSQMKEALKYYDKALFIEELHHDKKTSTYRNIQKIVNNLTSRPDSNRSGASPLSSSRPYFKTVHRPT